MTYQVSDFIVERLTDWGVNRIYGYPGDGINPLISALNRADEAIDFVQVRHEAMAAFMACAHAKFTGDVGVCLATSGPGAIQLLNGLYDAKMDHQPVLAIIGQQQRSAIGASYIQDVDLQVLFHDVAHEYVNTATTSAQIRHLLDRSLRIALAERTVTCLILPHDIQSEPAEAEPKREHGKTFSGIGYSRPRMLPTDVDLQHAADILNQGTKVAILVGAGALAASEEIIQIANILGAGVAKALLGKAALPDELSFVTGSIGMLGTEATQKMMSECDTLLMIGSNFPYAEFLPKEGQAKGVQIDIDGRNLSLRFPMDASLQGDSGETLRALLPLLQMKTDRSWRTKIEGWVSHWWKVVDARAQDPADPLNPQRVFSELSTMLPHRSIISADSGTSTVWYARNIKIKRGMMASVSGGLASMGCAVPYAIAAKFAFPDRPAIALVGDGAMQMSGNNELITISKYWKEWRDPRLMVVVLNNRDLNFVTWEMRVMEGDPKFEASQNIPDFSYANYAESIGLRGLTIASIEDMMPVLNAAVVCDRPVVVDVHCDPNIPPLPPHISVDQAQAFTSSMLKGDPDTPQPLLNSLTQMWRSIFHIR
ncbi:MAG: thiamine pyrophosphate-requiring protein [Candidatus Obscuribacterales bacterium]|nr:thiamine pyrophosphate-requiring protein [Candidatus Obscuribacterales bacterium]